MPITLSIHDSGFEAAFGQLLAAKRESAVDVDAAVTAIIDDVARRGDAALIYYTRRFDRLSLTPQTYIAAASIAKASSDLILFCLQPKDAIGILR